MPTLNDQQGPYIPETDAGVRDWLNNFASVVASNPVAVGLTVPDSQTLSTLASAYDAAYVLATNPLTRTTPNIADKDAKRNQAVDTFRVFAAQIKANLGVSDEVKLALGLHLDDNTHSPIPAPTTKPLLAIIEASAGVHTLRYADELTPASRKKAPGAIQLQLYAAVGAEPNPDVSDASFIGVFTKQPFTVTWPPQDAGKTATYFGRWVTRRGLVGPWSLPVAMQIAFGGPVELQSMAA